MEGGRDGRGKINGLPKYSPAYVEIPFFGLAAATVATPLVPLAQFTQASKRNSTCLS